MDRDGSNLTIFVDILLHYDGISQVAKRRCLYVNRRKFDNVIALNFWCDGDEDKIV